jgi:hypothetical protein
MIHFMSILFVAAATAGADDVIPADPQLRWWKGNIHTHTLWSDGDDFPEMVAEWYREHGYDFLALSDHNVLAQGEKWIPLAEVERRGGPTAFAKYLARFGEHWVESRAREDGSQEVRLKPLNEFRALLEERGRFILIQSEEITDEFARLPIHMNATNLVEKIAPQHGDSIEATIRNNLAQVLDQSARMGQPMMAHINHPNFGWALTAEIIAAVTEERFFEVFNGHTSVHNAGDAQRASTERMWDIANSLRLGQLNAPPLFGLATDDSHSYHGTSDVSVPGRGWIMVRARHLTPESIVRAMQAGDFYASTGVVLSDVRFDTASNTLTIEILPDGDATFSTQFIGTRRGAEIIGEPIRREDGVAIHTTMRYSDEVGEVFAEVDGLQPSYTLAGDELYVRAVITSSAAAKNPTDENRLGKAWTQPVGWQTGESNELTPEGERRP